MKPEAQGRAREDRVRRRQVLAAVALLALPVVVLRGLPRGGQEALAFTPLPRAPGFRRLVGAAATTAAGGDPFLGLPLPGAAPPATPLPAGALCDALFEGPRPPGTLPVAVFSDYRCPQCRDLARRLAAREGPGLALTWHELPLLGPASEAAARAALAAGLQGAGPAMRARLLRATFQPTPRYLEEVASGLGLDAARLAADAEGPEVAAILAKTRRAAASLGIAATPGLVVGRSFVPGAPSEARLEALLAEERALGPLPC